MGDQPESPIGGRGDDANEDEMNRWMIAFRRSHVRGMIARGEIPHGYRIDDTGTGFVRKGNRAWPLRPLDPFCSDYGEPSLELLLLIREVFPDFDPENDPRAWREVAELIRRTGRPAAEVETMWQQDLLAFFRVEVFYSKRAAAGGEQKAVSQETAAPGEATTPAASDAGTPAITDGNENTRTILRRMLDDPLGRARLIVAGSAKGVAELIGKSVSTVKETKPEWHELRDLLLLQRTNRRIGREMRDGRNR